jgi:hypothetical protein
MSFAPVISSLFGAVLGAFFGFMLQVRNQRIERKSVINLLIGQVSYVYTTLTNMRRQSEIEISEEGKIKFSTLTFNEAYNNIEDIAKHINIYFKLDQENIKLTLKLIYESSHVNNRANSVQIYADAMKHDDIKEWFYYFALNWNIYLESLESLIIACETIIDQNKEMCLIDLKLYESLKSINKNGNEVGKIDLVGIPADFRRPQ